MIPAYTANAILGVTIVSFTDIILKTYLMKKRSFWYFMAVVMVLTFLFDNYMVRIGVYNFNPKAILNIFLPYAPIENFMMSYSLITANIIIFEWQIRKNQSDNIY